MRHHEEPDWDDAPENAPPSKSQLKRDMEALQDMGGELVKLSKDRLKRMDLPDALLTAVLEAQRITSHGAIRRQMQLIGKLMRGVDPEPIAEQLAEIRGESDAAKAVFHALERWRERLLTDDDALTLWLAEHPEADAQQLRQLIRNARREAAEGKPPKSSRALFKLIRDAG
jgi:ribosome-associated protein